MTPVVYKHNGTGFGNLVILMADCQDKCHLIHEDVLKYELGNCISIGHFHLTSIEGTHPECNIYINDHTVNNIHPRIRSFISPTEYMKSMLNDRVHLLDGVSACVHIRRGSYSKEGIAQGHDPEYYYCSDSGLAKFEDIIRNEPGRIYLASDSAEVKQNMKNKFGNKIVTLDTSFACISTRHDADQYERKALQDIYLEWFLISMCPKVYVTGGRTDFVGFSTFGYSAAIYGAKPFGIVFNDTPPATNP